MLGDDFALVDDGGIAHKDDMRRVAHGHVGCVCDMVCYGDGATGGTGRTRKSTRQNDEWNKKEIGASRDAPNPTFFVYTVF